jgi:hypothetical protein
LVAQAVSVPPLLQRFPQAQTVLVTLQQAASVFVAPHHQRKVLAPHQQRELLALVSPVNSVA